MRAEGPRAAGGPGRLAETLGDRLAEGEADRLALHLALCALAALLLAALAARRRGLGAARWRSVLREAWQSSKRWVCVNVFGHRMRAGCVPVRIDPGGRLKVLLIHSRNHPEWLTFPAGGVERHETFQHAAVRETFEEAGVSGKLGKLVAEVHESNAWTVMFSMHVHTEHDEYSECSRGRCWLDLGVPGSPQAAQAANAVRSVISPKAIHQRILDHVLEMSAVLAKESEMCEQESRLCGAPADSVSGSLRLRGSRGK